MSTLKLRCGAPWLALAGALAAALPAPAGAQVGAIGAAPAFFGGREDRLANAPILTESAFRLGRGQLGGAALFGVTSGGFSLSSGFGSADFDFTYSQLLLAAYYAPTDKVMLGGVAAPYVAFTLESGGESADSSGRGDVALYGKAGLWQSAEGATSLAAFGSLVLPAAQEGWGHEGAVLGAGLAVSQRMDRLTLHGAGGFALPTDDADGESVLNLAGAAVYSASPGVALSFEVMLLSSDGESLVDVAPGARFRIGSSFFLSAAVQANATSSTDVKPYDYAFVLGANLIR